MNKIRLFAYFLIYFFSTAFIHCVSSNKQTEKAKGRQTFYAPDEFKLIQKIDAHIHLRTTDNTLIKEAEDYKFKLININVYGSSEDALEEQRQLAIHFLKKFAGITRYSAGLSIKNFNQDTWTSEVINYLGKSFIEGAIAVKIYKNIGMELKDRQGNLVMIDNPRFDSVLDFIASRGIPVIGHLGEPRNCWLPIGKMTVAGDRKYFSENPGYHMYLHPELPSYEQQVAARDHMLEKHPNLKFIGAHLGSLEWSVDELAKRLDKYPNMVVDMAARISHFRYQAITNWQKVHDFFIKYQDRLLYGTDIVCDNKKSSAEIKALCQKLWWTDWIFFISDAQLTVPQMEGPFKGLKLPRQVIDKIYFKNAEKWLPDRNS